jgi:Flp pilus assembly protein TadG
MRRRSRVPDPHPQQSGGPQPTLGSGGRRSPTEDISAPLAKQPDRRLTLRFSRTDSACGESGNVAIEFAFLAPLFLLLILAGIEFGLLIKNYVILTNAVDDGAMLFSISRSSTTPYTNTINAIEAAAPSLTAANLTITLSVNSTACTSDSTCSTALTAAAPSGGTLTPATVTATYPCGLQFSKYIFWSASCNLSATMTEGVQ